MQISCQNPNMNDTCFISQWMSTSDLSKEWRTQPGKMMHLQPETFNKWVSSPHISCSTTINPPVINIEQTGRSGIRVHLLMMCVSRSETGSSISPKHWTLLNAHSSSIRLILKAWDVFWLVLFLIQCLRSRTEMCTKSHHQNIINDDNYEPQSDDNTSAIIRRIALGRVKHTGL